MIKETLSLRDYAQDDTFVSLQEQREFAEVENRDEHEETDEEGRCDILDNALGLGRKRLAAQFFKSKEHEYGANDDGYKQVILWLGADYFVIPNQLDLKAKLFVRSGKHSNMGGDASGIYF